VPSEPLAGTLPNSTRKSPGRMLIEGDRRSRPGLSPRRLGNEPGYVLPPAGPICSSPRDAARSPVIHVFVGFRFALTPIRWTEAINHDGALYHQNPGASRRERRPFLVTNGASDGRVNYTSRSGRTSTRCAAGTLRGHRLFSERSEPRGRSNQIRVRSSFEQPRSANRVIAVVDAEENKRRIHLDMILRRIDRERSLRRVFSPSPSSTGTAAGAALAEGRAPRSTSAPNSCARYCRMRPCLLQPPCSAAVPTKTHASERDAWASGL